MLPLLPLFALASPAPFWGWEADVPSRTHRVRWDGAVAMVVRPVAGTWRALPRVPDPAIPGLVVPERGAQAFEVLDASREPGVPRRVTLALTRAPRTRDAADRLLDAPLDPKARYLALLEHPTGRAWDAPDAARALLHYDRAALAPGTGAKGRFLGSLAASLGRRRTADAPDAYAWLGEEFRAEVGERHNPATGAYLADVTDDPTDRQAAGAFGTAALRAEPNARVLLSYLGIIWGSKAGSDFSPFFAALRAVKADPNFDSRKLLGLLDVGAYRVVPAPQAASLAEGFERTPLLLFLLGFGYGDIATQTLRRVYEQATGLPDRVRLGYYQFVASEIGGEMVRLPPEGSYPIWYRDGIKNETQVRAKLDAYFGLTSGKP